MSYDELQTGLSKGRRMIQEEWANPSEIEDTDKLIELGYANATKWEYKDGFQCERRIIQGIKQ